MSFDEDKLLPISPCPFCACAMRLEEQRGGFVLDGDHNSRCPFYFDNVQLTPFNAEGIAPRIEDWNHRA